MRGAAQLLIDMGRIFVMAALVVIIVGTAGVLMPRGVVGSFVEGMLARFGGTEPEPYEMFAPDELVHDNLLGADVPRLYYLWIPKLALEAPVVAAEPNTVTIGGQAFTQLHTPHAFAAGWSTQSAQVGVPGNTVMVGHNNIYGEVFKDLWLLQNGDQITVRTASGDRSYSVSQVVSFEERDLSLNARRENARWIAATDDERLTLVTCWPYWNNTHRLVVVAKPEA